MTKRDGSLVLLLAGGICSLMIAMGIDTSNPAAIIEMQKDFQALRDWRQSMQAVRRHGLMTAIGVLTVGTLGLIYMHFTHR